jgi:hypothetical protein
VARQDARRDRRQALGHDDGKRTGELLRVAGTADVVDAHLALVVDEGDRVLTSDARDIEHLLASRSIEAIVTPT